MKIVAFCKNQDTKMGLSLAGIDAIEIDVVELTDAFNKVASDKNVGIILMEDDLINYVEHGNEQIVISI